MSASTRKHTAREQLLSSKQKELDDLLVRHDALVREAFHMEKFVTMTDFDPVSALSDRSDVFQQFQARFDLMQYADEAAGVGAGAGVRTTRRALNQQRAGLNMSQRNGTNEQSTSTSLPNSTSSRPSRNRQSLPSSSNTKTERLASSSSSSANTPISKPVKGRKSAPPNLKIIDNAENSTMSKSTAKSATKKPAVASTPKKAASSPASSNSRVKIEHPTDVPTPSTAKGKKRSRPPNRSSLGRAKRTRLHDFGPPVYTNPFQLPLPKAHDGALTPIFESYHHFGDEPERIRTNLPKQIEAEASLASRIANARRQGRLLDTSNFKFSTNRPPHTQDGAPLSDLRDDICDQIVRAAKVSQEQRRQKIANCKKIAKAITAHFDEIRGVNEMSEKELERSRKALARALSKEVRKKWKLAVNIVKAKYDEEHKAEQERQGKLHLDAILEQSTQMIAAHRQEIVGRDYTSDSEQSYYEDDDDGDDEDGDDEDGDDEDGDDEDGDDEDGDDEDGDEGEYEEKEQVKQNRQEGESDNKSKNGIENAEPEEVHDGDNIAVDENGSSNAKMDTASPTITCSPKTTLYSAPRSKSVENNSLNPDTNGNDNDNDNRDDFELAYNSEEEALDRNLEAEMEQEEGEHGDNDDDSEMDGLAADADVPIEELLKRYNYPAEDHLEDQSDEDVKDKEENEENEVDNGSANEHTEINKNPEDNSLSNEDENEFKVDNTEDVDKEDAQLEDEMEAEEQNGTQGSDEELNNLQAEADASLEDLLGAYRPGMPELDSDNDTKSSIKPSSSSSFSPPQSNDVDEDKSVEDESGGEDAEKYNDDEASSVSSEISVARVQDDKPKLRQPFLFRGKLRPYQHAGFEWLASLYNNSVNGILADEMGLGKTIQTIALLAWLACEKGQWGPHLIVVPTSVLLNWDMEFKKFLPGFKVLTYYGNLRERKEKRRGWYTENAFHVCLVSYQIVLSDEHMFRRKPWQYMILDEAHNIKNFRSQRWQTLLGFNTQRRLLLTGTPLQNSLMELWSLLYFLNPNGIADSQSGPFADQKSFQAWFSNPMDKAIEEGEIMDEETRTMISKLHTVLRPYLLRRLKADVEKEMPRKFEHVLYCKLSKRQRFLYDEFLARSKTRETLASGQFMSIINCLMQLRKVCNHPDLFEIRPIVTSFALPQSVIADFEVKELLTRRQLLSEQSIDSTNASNLIGLNFINIEGSSKLATSSCSFLGSSALSPIHTKRFNERNAGSTSDVAENIDTLTINGWKKYYAYAEKEASLQRVQRLAEVNKTRCSKEPSTSSESVKVARRLGRNARIWPLENIPNKNDPQNLERETDCIVGPKPLSNLVKSIFKRSEEMDEQISRFGFSTPAVVAKDLPERTLQGAPPLKELFPVNAFDPFHQSSVRLSIAFPDRSLLQYDCGKLQRLDELLRHLQEGGHRALIFTQMTKVLDILESFLNFQGHRYLRLDGATKIEDRQMLTERFNLDDRILCFISSTRAGGLGINLTGADTVIFYDSDWNPSADRQCQDRCHRIGQTRDVHVYRFVCESTIEENMLRRANQKRLLNNVVVEEANLTTEFFSRMDWKNLLTDTIADELGTVREPQAETPTADDAQEGDDVGGIEMRKAFAAAEDEEDAAAAQMVEGEMVMDQPDFAEQPVVPTKDDNGENNIATPVDQPPPQSAHDIAEEVMETEDNVVEEDELEGTIDGYMLKWVEQDWEFFQNLVTKPK